jgi:CRP-like cAMP-binding protein
MEVLSASVGTVANLGLQKKIVRGLAQVPMFTGLDPAQLLALAREMQAHVYQPGERIFEKGDEGEELHLVLEGTVHLTDPDERGAGERVVVTVGPGEAFGEIGFLTDAGRSLCAVNGPAESLQFLLSRLDFDRLVSQMPAVGCAVYRQLVEVVASRLQELPLALRNYLMWGYGSPPSPGR